METDIHGLTQNTPLDTDFGHSPVGLAGRAVKAAHPAAPRTVRQGIRDFGEGVCSLALRLVNFATPSFLRANDKFRVALTETSQRVGELLGALSDPADVDAGVIGKRLAAMDRALEPLVGYGAKSEDVIAERLKFNLKHKDMTDDQLIALGRGVAQARKWDDLKSGEKYLDVIQTAVSDQIAARIRSASPDKPRNGLIKETYSRKQMAAEASPKQDAIEKFWRELRGTLAMMPIEQLRDLLNSGVGGSAAATTDRFAAIDLLIEQLMIERLQTGKKAFMATANNALAHAKSDQPSERIKNIVKAVERLEDLRQSARVVGVPPSTEVDAEVDKKVKELSIYLQTLLSSAGLEQMEFIDLFREIPRITEALGVPGVLSDVRAELARRDKQAGLDEYALTMRDACTAAISGDTALLLGALDDLSKKVDSAQSVFERSASRAVDPDTHEELVRYFDDPNTLLRFRDHLNIEALARLDTSVLEALYNKLNDIPLNALYDNITTITPKLADVPALGRRLSSIGYTLGSIREATLTVLRERGKSPPPFDRTAYGTKDLTAADRVALCNFFGVEVTEAGITGIASAAARAEFTESIAKRLRRIGQADRPLRVFTREVNESENMWQGLNQVQVTVESRNGTGNRLESKSSEKLSDTVKQIDDLVDGNNEMLALISKFVGSATLETTVAGMESYMSPIRLPDGTAGAMRCRVKHDSIDIRSDGNGGVVLKCRRTAEKGMLFLPHGGEAFDEIALDTAASRYQFDFEVRIDKDKKIDVSGPVRYSYDIRPSTGSS